MDDEECVEKPLLDSHDAVVAAETKCSSKSWWNREISQKFFLDMVNAWITFTQEVARNRDIFKVSD